MITLYARVAGARWLEEHPDILIAQAIILDHTNLENVAQYERRLTERDDRYPGDLRPV